MRPSPFKKQNQEEVVAAKARLAGPKAKTAVVVRDGLEWLIKRGTLSEPRTKAACWYRHVYREGFGPGGGCSLTNLVRVDTSARDFSPCVVGIDARWAVLEVRTHVLRSQDDMLTVMDGVVGAGHTLRALAGGDKDLADAMKAVLMVALDLVHDHLTNGAVSDHLKRIPIRASADRPSR